MATVDWEGNGNRKTRTFCDARETVDRSRKIFTTAVRFFFSQVPDRQDQLSAEGETGERKKTFFKKSSRNSTSFVFFRNRFLTPSLAKATTSGYGRRGETRQVGKSLRQEPNFEIPAMVPFVGISDEEESLKILFFQPYVEKACSAKELFEASELT